MKLRERASEHTARRLPWIGVSLWLSLWVLTLPLFHIHTVAEAHQGVAHTVFSPDLPGEYVAGLPDAVRSESTARGHHQHNLRGGQSYPELSFATPLPQANTFHKPGHYDVCVSASPDKALTLTLRHSQLDVEADHPQWLLDTLSPRSPPGFT